MMCVKMDCFTDCRMKMYRLFKVVLPVFMLVLFVGCHPKMAPVGKSDIKYEDGADKTIYTVAPYGAVEVSGKWMEGKYNPTTHQQFLYHKDTATLVLTIDACRNSPFYKKGTDGFGFVKKYYELESQYQQQLLDQKPELLEEDTVSKFLIWKMRQDGIDQYFLCGIKDCKCGECSYRYINLKSRKHDQSKAVAFLRQIFLSEK